ncbi:hypothetical protein SMKC034_30010 [Serratia marcescens]|nr:hypothetical protein SMKC034_30010 [Serratia marcescens]
MRNGPEISRMRQPSLRVLNSQVHLVSVLGHLLLLMFIMSECGEKTIMKLQKLAEQESAMESLSAHVYYAQ